MTFSSRKRTSDAGDGIADGEYDHLKSKRARTESTANSHQSGLNANCKVDANGDHYWEISKMRRVTVSNFRGKTMVSIREYYEKDGQELPGKKGISMPMDQYAALVTLLPDIEIALKQNGQSVPRPNYTDANIPSENVNEDQDKSGSILEEPASPKKNIEATSDEGEG